MGAGERDEFLRAAWRALVAEEVDADRLVFVEEEMGANVSLSALYAWSRKGERAFGSAPRNWGKNVTLVASITEEGVGPCLAVEGSTTREVFEAYLEGGPRADAFARAGGGDGQPLRPQGREGQGDRRGVRLRAVVPASLLPGLQPDRAGLLEAQGTPATVRGTHPRSTLIEAMGRALSAITAPDARGFFGHCGYREVVQLL
jgi:hypothetical protein